MIVGLKMPVRGSRRTFGDSTLLSEVNQLTGGAVRSTTDEIKLLKVELAAGILGVAIAGIACVASALRPRGSA